MEKEHWWEHLKEILRAKQRRGEPLCTLDGVRNEILEVGEDYFVVRSERRKSLDSRPITKERVEYVLKIVLKEGYFDSRRAERDPELRNLRDGSGLKGAHTAIVRGLLIYLPFIKKEGRARIVFSPSDYDKNLWDIE